MFGCIILNASAIFSAFCFKAMEYGAIIALVMVLPKYIAYELKSNMGKASAFIVTTLVYLAGFYMIDPPDGSSKWIGEHLFYLLVIVFRTVEGIRSKYLGYPGRRSSVQDL